MPKVISCNEHKREVTVLQNIANKQLDRAFTFDKVYILPYEDSISLSMNIIYPNFNILIFSQNTSEGFWAQITAKINI